MYSKGIMWLDDCRIPFVDEGDKSKSVPGGKVSYTDVSWGQQAGLEKILQDKRDPNQQGRFTPNLLVSDNMLNDGVISKSQRGRNDVGKPTYGGNSLLNSKTTMNNTDRGFDDKGSNSRYYDLDLWFDKMLEGL